MWIQSVQNDRGLLANLVINSNISKFNLIKIVQFMNHSFTVYLVYSISDSRSDSELVERLP
jgi:hypothetical protein